jgi:porin
MALRRVGYTILPILLACAGTRPALAQRVPSETGVTGPGTPEPAVYPDGTDLFTGFWRRPNLLGDMGGLRNVLGNYGITLTLQETSEVLGNATGGLKQSATYDGLTLLQFGLDTQKAFGWEGGSFNLSALQINGRNFSQFYLDNRQTASGIEAQPTTRFWEIWFQQAFFDGRFDVRLGQQSLDQEFMVSQGSSLFLNTMMGWPMLPSADLYAGGPGYPLSSLWAFASAASPSPASPRWRVCSGTTRPVARSTTIPNSSAPRDTAPTSTCALPRCSSPRCNTR